MDSRSERRCACRLLANGEETTETRPVSKPGQTDRAPFSSAEQVRMVMMVMVRAARPPEQVSAKSLNGFPPGLLLDQSFPCSSQGVAPALSRTCERVRRIPCRAHISTLPTTPRNLLWEKGSDAMLDRQNSDGMKTKIVLMHMAEGGVVGMRVSRSKQPSSNPSPSSSDED